MGIAALHPSYKSGTRYGYLSSLSTAVKTRMNQQTQQTQNARLMSSSMVFRTQSRHRAMFVSRSTCSAVPAREQDETLVQQHRPILRKPHRWAAIVCVWRYNRIDESEKEFSMSKFAIGEQVENVANDHETGTVVAVFPTVDGSFRYAVDTEGYGTLQFFAEEKLALAVTSEGVT